MKMNEVDKPFTRSQRQKIYQRHSWLRGCLARSAPKSANGPILRERENELRRYVATYRFFFVSFVENRTVLAILDRNCGKWLLEPANLQHEQVDFHGGFENVGGWPPPMVLK